MPKLWNDTLETHRREVHDAILDAAATLVSAHGLRAVTMAGVAEHAGIGRATLYRYFPGVDAILQAWHERHVDAHLAHLDALARGPGPSGKRLEALLRGLARRSRPADGGELATVLHADPHVALARERIVAVLGGLLSEAGNAGEVRSDVPAPELAAYCLHALDAGSALASEAALDRLVTVVRDGLRPTRTRGDG